MRLSIILLTVLLLTITPGYSQTNGKGYQQYFRHIGGEYPDDDENGFSEEANGIAHDDKNWYITQTSFEQGGVSALWKIPVSVELEGVESNTDGVSVLLSDQISCPTQDGIKMLRGDLHYNHLGDLVAYKAKDQKYYLLVPIENGSPGPAIAVFRADNLQCLGFDVLWIDTGRTRQNNSASWCAVDLQGYIYTSPEFWNSPGEPEVKLFKYSLNWDEIITATPKLVKLTFMGSIALLNESGQPLPNEEIGGYAQGGEFSSDGKLLYVTSGYGNDEDDEYWGIHVFETTTWRRVARSHVDGFFHYDCSSLFSYDAEPEGLTVWDLDEGKNYYWAPPMAPNISGQLHVLLLNNDGPDDDNVYLFHYTNTIYVDHSYTDTDSDGWIGRPFVTVGDALAFYNQYEFFDHGHWTGGRIKIQAGTYNEAITVSRRVQIVPWSGKAVVGSKGGFSLFPGGAINVETGGGLKIY